MYTLVGSLIINDNDSSIARDQEKERKKLQANTNTLHSHGSVRCNMDTLAVWHSTPFQPFGDDGVATTFVFLLSWRRKVIMDEYLLLLF